MNALYKTSRTLGARLLLGALAILLVGSLDEGPSTARAENKKPEVKTPPKTPNKKPAPKAVPVLPKPHPNAEKHPPVLAALHHLQKAFAILAEHANPLLGDERLLAMEKIRLAFVQINRGIAGPLGMNQPESTTLLGLPPGNDFPPVRKALESIRDAQTSLKR